MPEADLDLMLAGKYKQKRDRHAYPLTDNGRISGTLDPKLRERPNAEDEHGVEYNIDYRTCKLRKHGKPRLSHGLQDALAAYLNEQSHAEHHADTQIPDPQVDKLGIIGEQLKEGRDEKAHYQEHRARYEEQEQAVACSSVGAFLFLHTKTARDIGVHAHARTDCEAYHKHLQGVRKRNGIECGVAELGNEVAVHDIVHRLHQHGYDKRNAHCEEEPANGHGSHLVSFIDQFFIIVHSSGIVAYPAPMYNRF